jgi:hypothetical protein
MAKAELKTAQTQRLPLIGSIEIDGQPAEQFFKSFPDKVLKLRKETIQMAIEYLEARGYKVTKNKNDIIK